MQAHRLNRVHDMLKEDFSTPIFIQPGDDLQELVKETCALRRKVVTVGREMDITGWELHFHSHWKAQLMLAL